MDYSTFVYTRDFDEDYCWHVKPDELPASFCRLAARFIRMREFSEDAECASWEKTLFFLKYEGQNIICRILENGSDYVGRTIYSVEGLISKGQRVRSRLAMADAVRYFFDHPGSFAGAEAKGELPDSLTIEDRINPLLPSDLPEEVPEELQSDGFRGFIETIADGSLDYDCIFSPDADRIFPYTGILEHSGEKLIRHSCSAKMCGAAHSGESGIGIRIEPVRFFTDKPEKGQPNEEITIFLRIRKDGKTGGSYQWRIVRSRDGAGIKSGKQSFMDGIPAARLTQEEKILKTYFRLLGYDVS
ncbi:MAG: hypothetical protein K6F53_04855 [Lachnospiraceae bacterium]|nr:hypothetical protein [Lachnospiraceae bacterium]